MSGASVKLSFVISWDKHHVSYVVTQITFILVNAVAFFEGRCESFTRSRHDGITDSCGEKVVEVIRAGPTGTA